MQCFKCLYNCPKECWSKLSYISQRTQNRHQVYTENHCTKSLSYLTKYDHYVNFQSIIPSPCTVFFPNLQYILVENRKLKLYIWCFFLLNEDSQSYAYHKVSQKWWRTICDNEVQNLVDKYCWQMVILIYIIASSRAILN